jgi:glycosyltransferase involved in cell wall biosynthesis
MKIGILSYGFTGWGGGVDFIRHILLHLDEEQKVNPTLHRVLFLPKNNFLEKIKKITYPLRNLFRQIKEGKSLKWEIRPGFSSSYLLNTYKEFSGDKGIILSGSNLNAQLKSALAADVDVVFPCMDLPSVHFSLPWVGYIFDFQHHYYPEFFSNEEIENRNNIFQKMLFNAQHIVVNGHAVIKDAELFYPGHTARLTALPFSPCPLPQWLTINRDVHGDYDIESPYYLISNQFWKHKDHKTAFLAFKEYCNYGGEALLVCTGATEDYRFPNYFHELLGLINDLKLSNKIRILGHIPKEDQISLMRGSLGVIQPTLFEGGPGGGSAYEAISLGVPVIASSIAINLEMNCGDIAFFKAGDYSDLASILIRRGLTPYIRQDNEHLLSVGLERRKKTGKALINVCLDAISENIVKK